MRQCGENIKYIVAFPLQKWLRERATKLRYMNIPLSHLVLGVQSRLLRSGFANKPVSCLQNSTRLPVIAFPLNYQRSVRSHWRPTEGSVAMTQDSVERWGKSIDWLPQQNSNTHKNVETTNFQLCERKTRVMSGTSKRIRHTHTHICAHTHTHTYIFTTKNTENFCHLRYSKIWRPSHIKKYTSTRSKTLLM
jgi:hypothetical protein